MYLLYVINICYVCVRVRVCACVCACAHVYIFLKKYIHIPRYKSVC